MLLTIEQPEQKKLYTVRLKFSSNKAVLLPEEDVHITWTPDNETSKQMWEEGVMLTDRMAVPRLSPAIICTLRIGTAKMKFDNHTYMKHTGSIETSQGFVHKFDASIIVGSRKNLIEFSLVSDKNGVITLKPFMVYYDKALLQNQDKSVKHLTRPSIKGIGFCMIILGLAIFQIGMLKRRSRT